MYNTKVHKSIVLPNGVKENNRADLELFVIYAFLNFLSLTFWGCIFHYI
jgi:hypothetical protein